MATAEECRERLERAGWSLSEECRPHRGGASWCVSGRRDGSGFVAFGTARAETWLAAWHASQQLAEAVGLRQE